MRNCAFLAEGSIRPYCVGKKNWLFSNTDTGAHASGLFYSLIETAKANKVNPYDYLWYVLTKAPLCKTEEDWDQLLPWNMDANETRKMHDTRNSAAPDPSRTSPYVIRGAKDRDPLKEDKLAAVKAKKEEKELARAIKKAEKKDAALAKFDRLKKRIEKADKARDRVAATYGLKIASSTR